MRQRLGIAHALLGDPSVLILDEPANGLDPAGIRWMRDLLRSYADQGGTVLLSSHLLHEIEVIADDIVVIGNGRIVAQGTKNDLLAAAGTVVRSAAPTTLAHALELAGIASTARARRRRPHPGRRRPRRTGRPGRRRRPHRAAPRRRRGPGGDVPRAHRRDPTRRSSGMSAMTTARTTPSRPADRHVQHRIPATRVVGVELRKMFDTRSGFWMLMSIAITATLATGAVILWAPDSELTYDSFAAAIGFPMSVILPMLAILSVTSEWTQRSGLSTFTLIPHRGRVISAKAVATVIVGVGSMIVAMAIGALGNIVGTAITGTATVWDISFTTLAHDRARQRPRHDARLHARRGDPQLGRRDRRATSWPRLVLPTLSGCSPPTPRGSGTPSRGSTSRSPGARCSRAA